MKRAIQNALAITIVLTCIQSCSDLKGADTSTCAPACRSDLQCIDGQCQPIVCTASTGCFVGLVCNEGRCVYSCNGETPCPSGQCNADLCASSMECGNGEVRACSTACGEGVERCMNYVWSLCSAGIPTAQDACGDGLDGDCDDRVDEDCPDCEAGISRACTNDCGNGVQTCDVGSWTPCSVGPPDATGVCPCLAEESEPCETPCGRGLRTCESGAWGACLFDGEVCQCEPGVMEACETMCAAGQRTCEAGRWSDCDGGPLPSAEICGNGLDEDCDGTTDEDCPACNVPFLSGPMDVAELDSLYQDVPSVYANSSVWLGYYRDLDGRRVSTYVKYSFRNGVLALEAVVNSGLETILNLSPNTTRVLGVGIARNRDFSVEEFNTQGLQRTESMDLNGSIGHQFALANTPTIYGLYRLGGDGLYLQALPDGAPRPQPLRLADTSRFGLSPVLAANGLTLFYENEAGNFPEGRVISILRVGLEARRVLFDKRLTDPVDGGPVFGEYPAVFFGSDRYLLTYTRWVDNHDRIYTASVDLNGDITSGPHEVYRVGANQRIAAPEIVGSTTGALLVWSQNQTAGETGSIRYMALDQSGLSASQVVTITTGVSIFPSIAKSLRGTPAISWTETRQVNGQTFHAVRIASIPSIPRCR